MATKSERIQTLEETYLPAEHEEKPACLIKAELKQLVRGLGETCETTDSPRPLGTVAQ